MEAYLERMEGMVTFGVELMLDGSDIDKMKSHFAVVLNGLRHWPRGLQDQSTQLEALEVLHGLAVELLPTGDQFRPLASRAMRYCLMNLGQQSICPIRVILYELISTLAQVVRNEMSRVYPVLNEQMAQDMATPNCTYLERSIIDILREFAEDTESGFSEHLENAYQLSCGSIHNRDQGIRIASVKTLCSVIVALQEQGLTAKAQHAYKSLVPTFAAILRRDKRRLVVCEMDSALCEMFSQGMPPHSLSDPTVANPIFECIRDFMAKQMACQQDDPQQADDLAMSGVNILAYYAQALDPDLLASYFDKLHGSFVQFLEKTSAKNRPQFYGMVADCIDNLGHRVVPYYEFLVFMLMGGFVEPNPGSRQNSYCGIGLLVSLVGEMAVKNYPEILKALLNSCCREEPGYAQDNLSGALARMIVANLNAVPLDQVLPLFMSGLPITVDFHESQIVLEAFRILYDEAHSSVTNYIEQMLLTSIRMLHEEHLTKPESINAGAEFIKKIKQTYPDKFNKVSSENPEVEVYMRSIPNLMDEDQP